MKVITPFLKKGGIGKTTVSFMLAHGLANRGFKVLALDLDSQCNLTRALNVTPTNGDSTLLNVLQEETTIEQAKNTVKLGVLDVVPGDPKLKSGNLFKEDPDFFLLKDLLEAIREDYDFVILDCPSEINTLVTNALLTTDYLIIPALPDDFSSDGIEKMKKTVRNVARMGGELKVSGILITQTDRTTLTKLMTERMAAIAESIGTSLFKTSIRRNVAIKEAQALQIDPYEARKNSGAVEDYEHLIDEFLEREGIKK